ncbi:hypothetical protein AAG906_021511 [Vitis piasezkii]
MLKKDSFEWSGQAKEAFQKLKLAMTHTSVLALPNFNRIVFECDASSFGIEQISPTGRYNLSLYQHKFGKIYPIETQHSPAPSGENHSIFKGQLSTLDLAIIPKQMGKLKW